jgi:AraC-like DNA-binding protein
MDPRMPSASAALAEIAAIIARHASTEGEVATAIEGLYFSRREAPTPAFVTTQWPCFALVAQGAKSLTLGDEVFHYGVGACLIVALDLPVVSHVTQASPEVPNLGLGMAIRAERLASLMRDLDFPGRAAATPSSRGVSVATASPELLDATLRLLRLLDRPEHLQALAPLIEQEILYWLLVGPYGPRLMQIAAAGSPANRVARAIAWLREHYASPLRIQQLAAHVGMSASSLHHHFSAIAAMTPMQYQKQLRLREARRLMLVDGLDVGSAGWRVGYQSASQFSREYSRLHGRPPLRDVEALRASANWAEHGTAWTPGALARTTPTS